MIGCDKEHVLASARHSGWDKVRGVAEVLKKWIANWGPPGDAEQSGQTSFGYIFCSPLFSGEKHGALRG